MRSRSTTPSKALLVAATCTVVAATYANAPQACMRDGKRHLLVAAGDMLYAFRLN